MINFCCRLCLTVLLLAFIYTDANLHSLINSAELTETPDAKTFLFSLTACISFTRSPARPRSRTSGSGIGLGSRRPRPGSATRSPACCRSCCRRTWRASTAGRPCSTRSECRRKLCATNARHQLIPGDVTHSYRANGYFYTPNPSDTLPVLELHPQLSRRGLMAHKKGVCAQPSAVTKATSHLPAEANWRT